MSTPHGLVLIADAGHLGRTYPWRKTIPEYADPGAIQSYIALARSAEAAGIDAIFKADFIGLNRANARRDPTPPFESFQLAAAIAAAVPRITVIPTASVLFSAPYTVARNLVSLDHLAGGRLAWNLVTSFNGERNFGFDTIPDPKARYRQAGEFLDVVKMLWASWPATANQPDPSSGEYTRAELIQDIRHRGEFYNVEGAIDLPPRSPRLPLVIQAGASPDGIDSAIRQADAIFAAAPTLEQGEQLVSTVRARALALGRDPATLRFIFGVRATIAATVAQAEELHALPLSDTEIAIAREGVEREVEGLDLTGTALDEALPDDFLSGPSIEAAFARRRSRIEILQGFARRPRQTLRGFLTTLSRRGAHANIIGTTGSVVDMFAQWHARRVADGFILISGFDYGLFGTEIAPALRERGVVGEIDPTRDLRSRLAL